jgi:hypothetical protein
MSSQTADGLRRLAEAVTQRMEQERLTQESVKDRGGPSSTTLSRIKKGKPPVPSRTTFDNLDDGMGWVRGSAWRLYRDGDEPVPVQTPAERLSPLLSDAGGRVVPILGGGPLRRLIRIYDELGAVIEEIRGE